jgi:hypothetical protein
MIVSAFVGRPPGVVLLVVRHGVLALLEAKANVHRPFSMTFRHYRPISPTTPKLPKVARHTQHRLRGRCSERDNYGWPNGEDLGFQPGSAGNNFSSPRLFVQPLLSTLSHLKCFAALVT